jgi:hypothetical protein
MCELLSSEVKSIWPHRAALVSVSTNPPIWFSANRYGQRGTFNDDGIKPKSTPQISSSLQDISLYNLLPLFPLSPH